ncbi:MAG: TetR/AcrR family transcriptional regulator [Treponemataceae bacterium]|nr:TetR/AcrR family transcriptional regulator [Treponemataceae bacterium]
MAGKSASGKTTKERILDAAFSFCNEPRFRSFSMADLAARVGISKAAIYRHYKDKDAVIAAMYERFVETLAECLRSLEAQDDEPGISEQTFVGLVQFFAEHSCYINYMLVNLCDRDHFERRLVAEMTARGVKNLGGYGCSAGGDVPVVRDVRQYVRSIYCGVTIFIIIKLREKWIAGGGAAEPTETFARSVVRMLLGGLKRSVPAGHVLYPDAISRERFAELDALCAIGADVPPPEDRIFTALANVIVKYKFVGVTVDKIAAELNMAKSSLYEYFDNKNQMIKSLIERELAVVDMVVTENVSAARNFSEYMYILMRTRLSYYMLRPSIIPVSGWLLQTSTDDVFKAEWDPSNPWVKKFPDPLVLFGTGMKMSPRHFVSWLSSLPVALIVQWTNRALDQDGLGDALKILFDYMEYGIDKEAKEV